jgi:hypothetical protein
MRKSKKQNICGFNAITVTALDFNWYSKLSIIIFKMYRLLFSILLSVLVYSQVNLRLNTK